MRFHEFIDFRRNASRHIDYGRLSNEIYAQLFGRSSSKSLPLGKMWASDQKEPVDLSRPTGG